MRQQRLREMQRRTGDGPIEDDPSVAGDGEDMPKAELKKEPQKGLLLWMSTMAKSLGKWVRQAQARFDFEMYKSMQRQKKKW